MMTDITSRTSNSSNPRSTNSYKPTARIQRPRGDRGDVVAMMKRDMSYKAVAAANDDHSDESSISGDDSDNDHSAVSRNSHNSVASSSTATQKAKQEEAQAEGIDLRRKLVLLLMVVMACLVIVAIAAVSVAIQKEKEDQEEVSSRNSEDLIATLEDASQEQQNNLQVSLKTFAHSLTASTPPEQWPFVTHNPLFQVQGQAARTLSPAIESIAFSPLVEATRQQSEWQNYSWSHQNWIQDGWAYLGSNTSSMVEPIAPTIYQGENSVENPFVYVAPLWQTSPPPTDAVKLNRDMLTVQSVVELYQKWSRAGADAVLSPILPELPDLYGFEDDHENETPRSILLLAVQDSLSNNDNVNSNTVGLLQVVVNWERFLEDLIPKSATTTRTATVQNDCGDEPALFKYEEGSDRLVYYGGETESDDSNTEQPIVVLEQVLGAGIDGCSYTIELEMLQSTASSDSDGHDIAGILVLALVPLAIAMATLGVILVALLQWIQMVDDRHQKLVKTSAKSDAIVSSMFPSTIRDRLYAEEEDAAPNKKDVSKKSRGSSELGMENGSERVPATEKETFNSSIIITEEGEHLECYPEGHPRITASGSERLKTYLDTGLGADDSNYSAPIADLFPNCTVLFADIAGFTAWSSVREPSQVFTLLETLYKNFDDIAKKRHVFKVETVGDCYVAVTGLPEPQDDHAFIMVRFARDCMYKSYELTKKLEVTLGPDTAELSMRFGLHSGPVTAGVLRGDRARFQLFGDTVNTASRMESTGQKGRIQMTQETADILILLGKSNLVRQREDTVTAKGKGEMTTYWLALGADPDDVQEADIPTPTVLTRNTSGVDSIFEGNEEESESSSSDNDDLNDSSAGDSKTVATNRTMLSIRTVPTRRKPPAVSMSGLHSFKALRDKKQNKENRLVDWNVEILGRLLKHVIARRNASGRVPSTEEVKLERPEGQTVLEEVREIITLPKFDSAAAKNQEDPDKMQLDANVKEQLHDYVSTLASMYRDNPFHNYEHASHVTMSVVKLLSRIVAPKRTEGQTSEEKIASELHDHTYGITSDPLTQFAVVIAALMHDVDHTGVPNSQLVQENARVAAYYKNKSVAEQNSVDMSWSLLMEPQFSDLKNAIYCDEAELTRFRSLLVNVVMATDIVDKELKQLRNNRWDKAFSGDVPVTEEEVHAAVNRKATIVLEHLIQASDVSHTMQHWHVYRKWNERLFHEMYNAYRAGRADKDPSEFWYKGEIGFFDFYIIPLAKKLKDCGVFGVSSDEYLNYAMKNREEWARKGEAVTAEMVAKARDKDLARMERQASVRGPVIAEMKAAVASMRTPQKATDMFRQPSFRHLRTEPHATESIAMPRNGFRRQPPRRGTPNRSVEQAMSIGTAELDALKKFRQSHPPAQLRTGSDRVERSERSSMSAAAAPAAVTSAVPPESMNAAPENTGMRKPERRGSYIA